MAREIKRDFTATKGIRSKTPLLIGMSGPPGSGKTMSAIRLATGIKNDRGGPIIFLDTDGDRGKHYCPRDGEAPDGKNTFDIEHVSFQPPYSPLDFLEAINQQLKRDPACIIVDSASDEHEGPGGVLSMADAYLDRVAGNDYAKRDRMKSASWIEPKAERLAFINGVNRIKVPIIFCFRAREKTKPLKDEQTGKVKPTNIGWTPIAPPEIVGMMTLFCLLPNRSDGIPMWKGSTSYEDFSIKLPIQFRGMIRDGAQVDEEMGRAMSEWARGAPPTGFQHAAGTTQGQEFRPAFSVDDLRRDAEEMADRGDGALSEFWRMLSKDKRAALLPYGDALRARAAASGQPPAENASSPGPAQENGKSDDVVYRLLVDGAEQTFDSEGPYIMEYRRIVSALYSTGKASELLRFDQANKPLIASIVGLAETVAAVNAEIRKPAGGLGL